ncbi:MAG: hypothetical protein Tsb009_19740 [Planctomycetaceae bacterium]
MSIRGIVAEYAKQDKSDFHYPSEDDLKKVLPNVSGKTSKSFGLISAILVMTYWPEIAWMLHEYFVNFDILKP